MSGNSTSTVHTIALWGASQAGKTTALATYLGNYRPDWIEQGDPESRKTMRTLLDLWRQLRQNRVPDGTKVAELFSLKSDRGETVQFRDMKGGNTASLVEHPEDADALATSNAAMVFVEWPWMRSLEGIHAAQDALHELHKGQPVALLVTKCEAYLSPAEFAQFAHEPLLFGKDHSTVPIELVELIESFADLPEVRVFPVSAYGWNAGRPAHYCDEFGRLVPWRINPAQMERPFEYVLHTLRREVVG